MPMLIAPRHSRRQFLAMAGGTVAALHAGRGVAQAQAGPSRPLRLALLSDTHIPADAGERYRGFAPVENLAKVAPQVAASGATAAIIGGDLARLVGGAADYAALRMLLAPVTAAMPVAMILGNHDHRANFLGAFPTSAGVSQKVPNKHVMVLEHSGLRLVLLDSLLATDVTPGQLGQAQRTWLAQHLASAPPLPTAIVVHHTLTDQDGALVDAERLFDVVRPHPQVKTVLYGHSHTYEVRERDGLQLINLPAVGYNFADTQPVGWVDSIWTDEGVDLTLRAIGGNQAANGQTTSVHWAR
ncbi:MAG: metallophosphoesterase family protein [Luteitalea sp.]